MIFKRPWLVILILLFVIVFAVINILRAWNGVRHWDFLNALPLAVSPVYLLATGGLWSILMLRLAWWVWQGDPRTPLAVKTIAAAYGLYYWIDQLFLMSSPLRQTTWPFYAVISAGLVFSFFEIFRYRSVSTFFGGEDEQKDQQ